MGFFKRRAGLIGLLLVAIAVTVIPRYLQLTTESTPPPAPPPATTDTIPKTQVVEDTIQKGTTLVATLVDYDVPVAIANEVADLIKPVFDVHKLRFGNPFRLEKESDGTLKAFEYKIDDESVLKV